MLERLLPFIQGEVHRAVVHDMRTNTLLRLSFRIRDINWRYYAHIPYRPTIQTEVVCSIDGCMF